MALEHGCPQPDLSGALFSFNPDRVSNPVWVKRKKAGTEGGIAAQIKKI